MIKVCLLTADSAAETSLSEIARAGFPLSPVMKSIQVSSVILFKLGYYLILHMCDIDQNFSTFNDDSDEKRGWVMTRMLWHFYQKRPWLREICYELRSYSVGEIYNAVYV